jgi:type II secretory pathway component PulF
VKHYYWEGTDTNGVQHEGAMDSVTLSVARKNLQSSGFFILRFWNIEHSRLHRVLRNHEVTEFLLQLHRLLKYRVKLDDTLGFAVHEQINRILSLLLCRIREDLRNGLSLSSAL